MGVMHVFKAAQPALLYLSPACLLSTALVATYLKEWKLVLAFSEDSGDSSQNEDPKKAVKAVEKADVASEEIASPKTPRSTSKKRGSKKSE